MNRFKVSLLTCSLLIGLVASHLLAPLVMRASVHDRQRTPIILDALASSKAPAGVVLGDSVVVYGVDTRIVGEAAQGLYYNIGTVGQSIGESLLYLPQIPESTRRVVLVLNMTSRDRERCFKNHVYDTFVLSGYRLAPSIRDRMKTYCDEKSLSDIEMNVLQHHFEGRWVLRQTVDIQVRRILRPNLNSGDKSSLFWPAPSGERRTGKALQNELDQFHSRVEPDKAFTSRQMQGLLTFVSEARERNKEVMLVLAPIHPELRNFFGKAAFASLNSLPNGFGSDVQVLDLTDLLPTERFLDSTHPDKEGAHILSHAIGVALRNRDH